MVNKAEKIKTALINAFDPQEIEVIDESEAHRGHAGFQEGGESHFRVRLKSAQFSGKSRIARHRAVHAALGPELISQIHALALELEPVA